MTPNSFFRQGKPGRKVSPRPQAQLRHKGHLRYGPRPARYAAGRVRLRMGRDVRQAASL